jgi:uncharacterized protein
LPFVIGAVSVVLGGIVKGAIGVGLPLVVIPLMSLVIPSPQAIGLMVIPVLLSNIWQAYDSGYGWRALKRFAPLIVTQAIASIVTVRMTLELSVKQFDMMLAGAVLLAVVLMAFKPTINVSSKSEIVSSAATGLFSGLLGGISSLTGPVTITYLMALKLTKDEFVGAVSVIYFFGAIPVYAAMFWFHRIGVTDLGYSALALLPMGIGLALGKRIRNRLDESLFRNALLIFLSGLALVLLFK